MENSELEADPRGQAEDRRAGRPSDAVDVAPNRDQRNEDGATVVPETLPFGFKSVLCVFQVDRQPQFIQGYRVMYRQTSGLQASAWQNLDAKVPNERNAVLVNLKKGVTYEIKVRPYFNEFQGMDSESKTVRTTEEGQSSGSSHNQTYTFLKPISLDILAYHLS